MRCRYCWIIGIAFVLSLAMNGCTFLPPSPSPSSPPIPPPGKTTGEGDTNATPTPLMPNQGQPWGGDPLRENGAMGRHIAVLFVWDNSFSLSENKCKGIEFRKRFPAFFADTMQRMSTNGGLEALKGMQLSIGVLGGNSQGWKWSLGKWENVENWKNSLMPEVIEEQSWYRGKSDYGNGIKSAIETLRQVGDDVTNKVIVILTDGDFSSYAYQWEDDLLKQHAHLLWVFLPCEALRSQNGAQKKVFEEMERDRQAIVRLDRDVPEYEWSGQTWRALWKLITAGWPSDESQRVQWVDVRESEGEARLYMPTEVEEKHGWMVLHGCRWRERMQTVPDLKVKVKNDDSWILLQPNGRKGDALEVRKESEVIVQGVEKGGVVWSTYLVVQQPMIAEMEKRITNNHSLVVTLRRVGNWTQEQRGWPENIEVRVRQDNAENDGMRTMVWEGKQVHKCEATAESCDYRWEPEFTEEGTYRVTFLVDHVAVPWRDNTLTVDFQPDIVQMVYNEVEGKVLVQIAVENITEDAIKEITAEVAWLSRERRSVCCSVLPGEACHYNKAQCEKSHEEPGPITLECNDKKNSEGLDLAPLQAIISLELPGEFAKCKNDLPLRFSLGKRKIDINLANCKPGSRLIYGGDERGYRCELSSVDH